jgi:hypothetical protein
MALIGGVNADWWGKCCGVVVVLVFMRSVGDARRHAREKRTTGAVMSEPPSVATLTPPFQEPLVPWQATPTIVGRTQSDVFASRHTRTHTHGHGRRRSCTPRMQQSARLATGWVCGQSHHAQCTALAGAAC